MKIEIQAAHFKSVPFDNLKGQYMVKNPLKGPT